MNRRALSITLLVVGIVVLLVALGADLVGLGGGLSFGPQQAAGAATGAIVAAAGATLKAVP
jgi:hypothetical protein